MNQLTFRDGPQLEFILKEHRQSFESRVIDVYFKTAAKDSELPRIGDEIFLYTLTTNPKEFVAAYLGDKNQNPEHFFEITKGYSERDAFNFSKDILDKYNSNIEPFYDDLLYYDIKTVLDFHHVSFIDIPESMVFSSFDKIKNGYYKNLPITQVW